MTEYIERENALKVLAAGRGCGNIFSRAIRNIPAADVAPVRHGQWIDCEDDYSSYVRCSVCEDEFTSWEADCAITNFCPNCGARMDGGVDNA